MAKFLIIITITAIFYFFGDDQVESEKFSETIKIYNTIPKVDAIKIISSFGGSATIEEVVEQYNTKKGKHE